MRYLRRIPIKTLTILVDMDDVLNNLFSAWAIELNKIYKLNVNPKDIKDWKLSKYYPSLTKEEIFSPLYKNIFWASLNTIPDSNYYLRKLIDEGHIVYIVTATFYQNIKIKIEWLLKNYPFLKEDQVIVTSHKQLIKGDVLIDDAPHNLINGDYEKILFEASHNVEFDESTICAVRAKSWDDVYKEIHKIAMKEE